MTSNIFNFIVNSEAAKAYHTAMYASRLEKL